MYVQLHLHVCAIASSCMCNKAILSDELDRCSVRIWTADYNDKSIFRFPLDRKAIRTIICCDGMHEIQAGSEKGPAFLVDRNK